MAKPRKATTPAKPEKLPRGRPSKFTAELAAEILNRIGEGEPLEQICRGDHMPCDDTVRAWARGDPVFSQGYADARAKGFDAIAQRARMTLRGKDEEAGGESTGDVQRDKAIADFDLKLLAKWDPKRYGEKVQIDGDMTLNHREQSTLTLEQLRAMTPEARQLYRQTLIGLMEEARRQLEEPEAIEGEFVAKGDD